MFTKHYAPPPPPWGTKSEKAISGTKAKVKVIGLVVIWKDSISGVCMHAKYEVSIFYGSKVIVKVKVDNRQTNIQIDIKQTGQKQYAPIVSYDRRHKNIHCSTLKILFYCCQNFMTWIKCKVFIILIASTVLGIHHIHLYIPWLS